MEWNGIYYMDPLQWMVEWFATLTLIEEMCIARVHVHVNVMQVRTASQAQS